MTRTEKIRFQVLLAVVALLCLSLYYGSSVPDVALPQPVAAPVITAPVAVRPVSQVDELPSLLLLSRTPPSFSQSRRNVFEYGEGADLEPAPDDALAQPAESDVPETTTDAAPSPGSEITFVGLYREKGKPDSRLAAVSINKDIVVVGKGDILPGGYKVVKIEDNALTLSLIAEKKTLRYPLGRNAGAPTVLNPR